MTEYIDLDVSMKETAASIRREGERVWRGKCAPDHSIIAELVRKRAPAARRIVFETGPLSVWFYHSLRSEGLSAICIDARHAKAALDLAVNKTDANDADGLAHLAVVGFFREVRVKGFDSMLIRTPAAARTRLVRIIVVLSHQIQGISKRAACSFQLVRERHSKRMSGAFLSTRTNLLLSCYRFWRVGATFAPATPGSVVDWLRTLVKAKPAAPSCPSPASA